MTTLFGTWTHKLAMGIVVTLGTLNGSVMHPVMFPPPTGSSTAIVATTTTNATVQLPELTPVKSALIATSSVPTQTPATTTAPFVAPTSVIPAAHPSATIFIQLIPAPKIIRKATSTISASTSLSTTSLAPKTSFVIKTLPAALPSSTITAQWVLANTTTSFKQTYGGLFSANLMTIVNGQEVSWGLDSTSFGGTNGIPLMTASISCNPPPSSDPNVLNGELLFAVASPYSCSVTLTPLSGADRRTQTKTFSFTTPSGNLTISRATSMNSVLVNNENDGGIVFTNTDPNPITVTGLALNVSYSYLNIITTPLILRIFTPDTDVQLSDYHLENVPANATNTYAHSETLNASVVFTIPGSSQKMLPISVFGVNKMLMSATSPTISVSVAGATISRTDIKTTLNAPTISWSCSVVLGSADPNATSTYAACHN